MTTERKNVGSGKRRKNFGGSRLSSQRTTLRKMAKALSDLRKMAEALSDFVDAISAAGGVEMFYSGRYFAPVGDPEWTDLGDAYVKACDALGVEPKVSNGHDSDD